MQRFKFRIQGSTPVLINRFTDEAQQALENKTRLGTRSGASKTPREQAVDKAYYDKDGNLVAPMTWIIGTLRMAGSDQKARGSKKSLKNLVPAAVRYVEEFAHFHDPATGKKLKEFEVDSRMAKNKQGMAIMLHRPRLDRWDLRGELQIEDDLLDPSVVRELLDAAGRRYGIGAFRPSCGGPFGTFGVTEWAEVRETKGNGKDLDAHPMI